MFEVKKIESNGCLKLKKLKVMVIVYFCLFLGFVRFIIVSGLIYELSWKGCRGSFIKCECFLKVEVDIF